MLGILSILMISYSPPKVLRDGSGKIPEKLADQRLKEKT